MPSTATINTKWFQERIADRGYSQRKIAATLGMDPAAVSLMLRGKRKMTLNEAADLARLLGVPLNQVLDHAGIDAPKDAKGMIPIVGWVDDFGEVHMEKVHGPRRAPRPVEVPEGSVALRIQDRGPMDGWLAYYVPQERLDPDAVGRWAVIQLAAKGPQYLRVLARGYEPGKWTLQPLRPAGEGRKVEGVKVEWACPVVWIRA